MHKLGFSMMVSHPDNPGVSEQIPIFAQAGYDTFFLATGVTGEFNRIPEWADIGRKNGIAFEAVHAPAGGANAIWAEDDSCEGYLAMIRGLIDLCSNGGVDKLVMHVTAGAAPAICQKGFDRYAALEDYAEGKQVQLCFENGDRVDHLMAVLEHCSDYHGFCIDIGHHLCYAPQVPLLSKFGHKLKYTHIHDNMGIQRPGNPGDDMHLLPFDGILDWNWFASTLRNAGYEGTLNLELAARGKESYRSCTYPEFVAEAYKRIVKFRAMVEQTE